jgi:predicted aldo/keto reductase-like oxidoreductase
VRKLAASYLKPEASGRVKRVFVGASEDAELEANTSITQSFVHATDDEKVCLEKRKKKRRKKISFVSKELGN